MNAHALCKMVGGTWDDSVKVCDFGGTPGQPGEIVAKICIHKVEYDDLKARPSMMTVAAAAAVGLAVGYMIGQP